VARLVRNETPERYRVETGLIRDAASQNPTNSRQIDLLVHDPTTIVPLYRWEDFVVVSSFAAKAAIEVKSTLDRARFDELIEMHLSVRAVNRGVFGTIPTFGYALSGVTFETFSEYLAETIKANRIATSPVYSQEDAYQNLPTCVVVQEGNYIAVTPNQKDGRDWYCCAIKFVGSDYSDGMETGTFIDVYSRLIEPGGCAALGSGAVCSWFNRQQVPDTSKVYIGKDGVIRQGSIELHKFL